MVADFLDLPCHVLELGLLMEYHFSPFENGQLDRCISGIYDQVHTAKIKKWKRTKAFFLQFVGISQN
jgi:hypothetical protein